MRGRGRGRPLRGATRPVIAAKYSESFTPTPLAERLILSPLKRQEFDFTDLDNLMRQTDLAIRRAKTVLDQLAVGARPARSGSACS